MSLKHLSATAVLIVTLAIAQLQLAGGALAQSPMILPVDPAPLVAATADGERRFTIEVADDAGERSRGLMYREEMAVTHGMLFVFEATRQVGFWMKNTPMPLDLVFIGEDGVVAAILPGTPFSEAAISPGVPVRFVLELKQGTAKLAGMKAGDRVTHPEIDKVASGDAG
ncbi:MAG: DUF192 domain-containing protein [Rhizobiaceae bacterium]|nr:DUF192 domain-containing protein [Rhizobiaceae bacterium]